MLFHSLKIDFALASSTDPDEMPPNAAFHLGLHCLQKYPFRGFKSSKGLQSLGNDSFTTL